MSCDKILDYHFLLFSGILHISYAPEYEDIDEIREKFITRKSEVKYRTRKNRELQLKAAKRKADEDNCDNPEDSSGTETKTKKRRII